MARPQPAPQPAPRSSRRSLLIGAAGSLLLAAAGATAWFLRRTSAAASTGRPEPTPTPVDSITGAAPTTPSTPPTPIPTSPSTAAPSDTPEPARPTTEPTQPPTPLAEEGHLLYAEEFHGDAWPTTSGSGWSVAAENGAYTISVAPGVGNIWVYRPSPAGADMLVGVDVSVRDGEAGLILRFSDASNYLAFFVNPAARSFRLEQHMAGKVNDLIDEPHSAVRSGSTASNRLVARLEGEQVGLRINGQPVAALNLSDPPPALRYGMAAVAGGASVVATFQSLKLSALE